MQGFKTQFAQFPQINNEARPPQPPPPPQKFTPLNNGGGTSSVVKVLVICLLITLLVVGGTLTTVLAMRVWDPLWNPFRPKPEVVLLKTLANMSELKKASYKADINITANEESSKAVGKVSVSSEGSFDISGKLKQTVKATLNVNISGLREGQADAGTVSWEIVSDGENDYLKLNNLELNAPSFPISIETLAQYGLKVDEAKNQWYKTEATQDVEDFSSAFKTIMNANLWAFKTQLPDEGGNYHYVLVLDKAKAKKAITDSMGSQNIFTAMAGGMVDGVLEKLGEITSDVWIGKKDYYVHRYRLAKSLDLSAIDEGVIGTANVSFNLELSKFNLPIVLAAPTNAKDLEEITGPMTEKIKEDERNQKLENALFGVVSEAIALKVSDKNYLKLACLTETIKPYCDEIKGLIDSEPVIKKSSSAFCAYIPVGDKYYCVDSKTSVSIDEINVNISDKNPSLKGFCTGTTFLCPK